MQKEIQFWIEKLNELIPCGFYKFMIDGSYNWDYKKTEDLEDIGITVSGGASKMVLISEDSDYVIKFSISSRNYCEDECNNYSIAKDCGLGQYFAKCFYGGVFEYWEEEETPEGHTILRRYSKDFYLMEKAVCIEEDIYSLASSDKEYFSRRKSELTEDDEYSSCEAEVRICFEQKYGPETAEDIYEFCVEHSINDLHNENVGFVGDRLVFIDYSGY